MLSVSALVNMAVREYDLFTLTKLFSMPNLSTFRARLDEFDPVSVGTVDETCTVFVRLLCLGVILITFIRIE